MTQAQGAARIRAATLEPPPPGVWQCLPAAAEAELVFDLRRQVVVAGVECALYVVFYSDQCQAALEPSFLERERILAPPPDDAFVARRLVAPIPPLAAFARIGYGCQGFGGEVRIDDVVVNVLPPLFDGGFEP